MKTMLLLVGNREDNPPCLQTIPRRVITLSRSKQEVQTI